MIPQVFVSVSFTSGKAEYSYRKIAHGVKTESPNRSLESILRDEPWTLVSLQQASAYSGVYESFEPYLTELITYVRGFLSKAQLAWHQTWAYDEGSWHDAFSTYGSSQDKMYKAILACTQMIAQNPHFDGIVPCGTAIQNARGTEVKDRLTRDTYHLSFDCGRYVASCTWFEALTGNSSVGNSYKPETLTPGEARTCQECAHLAILNPYKVSPLE